MSTTAETSAAAPASSSLASSAAFGTFAIAFAIAVPVFYVLSELGSLPLFTYHPGTNRVDFGWAAARANEGPAMYWYGWVVTSVLGGAIVAAIATRLPRATAEKIPFFLVWFTPLPALAILAYALMPFWTR